MCKLTGPVLFDPAMQTSMILIGADGSSGTLLRHPRYRTKFLHNLVINNDEAEERLAVFTGL